MSTIAAISTAKGVGGIGVIRISGEDAIKIASKVFVPLNSNLKVSDMKGYTARYGRILKGNNFIDEAILLVFRAPNSYTGEDVVEISCHGGLYITREVLEAVLDAGAVLAEPGEFTKRAFMNGKMDLSQAESVIDIISAKSKRAGLIAFNQKEGALGRKVADMCDELLNISASLSVWADYPEDDISPVDSDVLCNDISRICGTISNMINNYNPVLKNGVRTAIVGKPNVGKSTFMNLISGYEKSIVTDIPGTTRDVVEETVMVGDIPLLLMDTAGIRDTNDIVEKIGVDKSKKYINTSEICVLILDASKCLSDEDIEIMNLCDMKRTIIILNKIDLGIKINENELSRFSKNIVKMSVLNAQGQEEFKQLLENMVGISDVDSSEVLVSNERQVCALKKAHTTLQEVISDLHLGVTLDAVTVLIQDATGYLMELTGKNVNSETINRIFSKFCVGK